MKIECKNVIASVLSRKINKSANFDLLRFPCLSFSIRSLDMVLIK